MELFEMKQSVARSQAKLEQLGLSLDLAGKQAKVEENNGLMNAADFWEDQKKAQRIIKETNQMKGLIDTHASLKTALDDLSEGLALNLVFESGVLGMVESALRAPEY